MEITNKIKAVVLGHAVGDALGVPVEFCSRAELDEKPITDMVGYGTYPYPEGCWSDDTSMSLAALYSLADGKLDFDDIMIRLGEWYYDDEFTPTGEMFDVGNTCSYAIDNYFAYHKPIEECGLTDERSNGNGSLMRIHPFSLMTWTRRSLRRNFEAVIDKAFALTHAHERSKLGCKIYTMLLFHLFDAPSKGSARLRRQHSSIRNCNSICMHCLLCDREEKRAVNKSGSRTVASKIKRGCLKCIYAFETASF